MPRDIQFQNWFQKYFEYCIFYFIENLRNVTLYMADGKLEMPPLSSLSQHYEGPVPLHLDTEQYVNIPKPPTIIPLCIKLI